MSCWSRAAAPRTVGGSTHLVGVVVVGRSPRRSRRPRRRPHRRQRQRHRARADRAPAAASRRRTSTSRPLPGSPRCAPASRRSRSCRTSTPPGRTPPRRRRPASMRCTQFGTVLSDTSEKLAAAEPPTFEGGEQFASQMTTGLAESGPKLAALANPSAPSTRAIPLRCSRPRPVWRRSCRPLSRRCRRWASCRRMSPPPPSRSRPARPSTADAAHHLIRTPPHPDTTASRQHRPSHPTKTAPRHMRQQRDT